MPSKPHAGKTRAFARLVVSLSVLAPGIAFAQGVLPPIEVTASPKRVAKKPKAEAPAAKAPNDQAPSQALAPEGSAVEAPGIPAQPGGQTVTTIEGGRTGETRAFT